MTAVEKKARWEIARAWNEKTFAAKKEHRRRQAKLPFEEKFKILSELQAFAEAWEAMKTRGDLFPEEHVNKP